MSNQAYPAAVRAATFIGDDNRKVPGNRGVKFVLTYILSVVELT
jgi:hypothetical protein